MELCEQGAENLAIGIVRQAVDEYSGIKRGMLVQTQDRNLRELERFFRSDWCEFLTGKDGDAMMSLVEKRVERDILEDEKRAEEKAKKLTKKINKK